VLCCAVLQLTTVVADFSRFSSSARKKCFPPDELNIIKALVKHNVAGQPQLQLIKELLMPMAWRTLLMFSCLHSQRYAKCINTGHTRGPIHDALMHISTKGPC
jgi:hypothetical protein